MRNRNLVSLGVLICVVRAIGAPFEGEIRSLREIADNHRGYLGELEGFANDIGEVATKDMPAIRASVEGLANGYEQAAKLFETGKPEEGRAMWGTLDNNGRNRYRWRERLELRSRQQRLAPQEAWVTETRNNLSPEVLPAFERLVEARKAASEAFGRAADATTIEADKQVVRTAMYAARDAEIEADISERRFNWTNETRELMKDRDISPEVQQKYAEMLKLQDELDQLQREREKLERRMRAIDELRNVTVDAARVAREAAVRAKNERK